MPKIIGLTGGIGSGKSKVASRFLELGVPCYTADDRAKHLMNTNPSLKEAIRDQFGTESYVDGILNRPFIAAIVFKDSAALSKINAIVHPVVAQDFLKWVDLQKVPYVIKEAAILFENGNAQNCDRVLLVTAPKKLRIERILARDNCSVESIHDRMSKQWEDAQKIPLADYHIENISWGDTLVQIDSIHQELSST